jgi:septal ring factor EnvC (AmiA/AmiB activator)
MNETIQKQLIDMAEAHLSNVRNELKKLHANRSEIDSSIENITKYVSASEEVIAAAKAEPSPEPTAKPTFDFSQGN